MTTFKCYPASDPTANWSYCPSFAAAILFAVLFGLLVFAHGVQAFQYRKPFAIVIVMGTAWECVGYIFRSLSVTSQLNSTFYTVQFLLIILAPLWVNAYIYMVLGRMIHFFLDDDRVFGLKARRITVMFVIFDILSFLVQATGASMSSGQPGPSEVRLGLHVYMAGVGAQLFFNCIFLALAIRFQQLVQNLDRRATALKLLKVVYAGLGLIIVRNIYRLVEYSLGLTSTITTHEWFAYVFDALPMLAAILILSIWNPGRVLQGARSSFSEQTRAIKQAKAEKKAEKKAAKRAAKEDRTRSGSWTSLVGWKPRGSG